MRRNTNKDSGTDHPIHSSPGAAKANNSSSAATIQIKSRVVLQ